METEGKKQYETAFLLKEESGVHDVVKSLKTRSAEIIFEGPVEKIDLAYKIKKESSAYFGYLHFEAAPEDVKSLNDDLRNKDSVLRFLIVTPPFVKSKARPSPRMILKTPAEPRIEKRRQPAPLPLLSNEALEKRIEEILQE